MEVCRNFCLLAFIMATNMVASSVDVNTNKQQSLIVARGEAAVQEVALPKNTITKRHTPFLPGDYWKDRRPEFGDTNTAVEVMVNGTGRLKCPITHVADSSVSQFLLNSLKFEKFEHMSTVLSVRNSSDGYQNNQVKMSNCPCGQ